MTRKPQRAAGDTPAKATGGLSTSTRCKQLLRLKTPSRAHAVCMELEAWAAQRLYDDRMVEERIRHGD